MPFSIYMLREDFMMKYSTVIFDFDYTLGDTTVGITESITYALSQMNQPVPDREQMRKAIGMSLAKTYAFLTGNESREEAGRFARLFKEKADKVMTASATIYPEAVFLLKELKKQHIKTGIVTTKYRHRIEGILAKFSMAGYIDEIIGSDNVKTEKPNPEGLLAMVKLLANGSFASHALYVGDSLIDAETAQNAGIDFAAVTTGTTAAAEFLIFPHIGIADNLEQLAGLYIL